MEPKCPNEPQSPLPEQPLPSPDHKKEVHEDEKTEESSSGPQLRDLKSVATNSRLFVGNLPFTVGEREVLQLFRPYGTIIREEFMWQYKHGPDYGKPKGYCFVEFSSTAEAQRAIDALDGTLQFGRRIRVNCSTNKETPTEREVATLKGANKGKRAVEEVEKIDAQLAALKSKLRRTQASLR